jgi:hypothetical protein
MHVAVPIVPEPITYEVETITEKCKKTETYKC